MKTMNNSAVFPLRNISFFRAMLLKVGIVGLPGYPQSGIKCLKLDFLLVYFQVTLTPAMYPL